MEMSLVGVFKQIYLLSPKSEFSLLSGYYKLDKIFKNIPLPIFPHLLV